MTGGALTRPSTPSRMVSLREQSSSTLQAAIRSPHDPGATLRRVNAVLGLYFDPDNDPVTRAAVREEFVRALSAYPDWAVQRAFDAWVKTGQRRPTPGEIVILVGRELKPLTDELAKRERDRQDRAAEEAQPSPEELAQRRAFASETMQRLGYAKAARPDGPVRADVQPDEVAEMRAHLAAKGMA